MFQTTTDSFFPSLFSLGMALLSLSWSSVATFWLCRSRGWLNILDHPGERSLHSRPTPRTGGLAIVSATLIGGTGIALSFGGEPKQLLALGAAVLLVATVSFADDRAGLAPALRFLAHLAAAVLLIAGGFGLTVLELPAIAQVLPWPASLLLTSLFVVWMINLYNFMDGMDGFAGGMAVFGFGTLAAISAYRGGSEVMVGLNLVIAAAAGGFLIFNFPPARIFMGDLGSSVLGLLAATMLLWAQRDGVLPLWAGVLLFSPFIVDATVTLVCRFWRREKIWQAHKTHYYQRLVQLGWGHRRTVLSEYALMSACVAGVFLTVARAPAVQWTTIGVAVVVYVLAGLSVSRLERKRVPMPKGLKTQ